jgi:hypothetical protein
MKISVAGRTKRDSEVSFEFVPFSDGTGVSVRVDTTDENGHLQTWSLGTFRENGDGQLYFDRDSCIDDPLIATEGDGQIKFS